MKTSSSCRVPPPSFSAFWAAADAVICFLLSLCFAIHRIQSLLWRLFSPELTCNWFVGFFIYLFGLNLWQLCSSCHWWMEKLRWILKKVSRCVFSKWCLVQIIEQSCFYLYFYNQILTVASTDKRCLAASERNNKEVINNRTWWHTAAFNVEVTALNQIIRLFFSLLLYIFEN